MARRVRTRPRDLGARYVARRPLLVVGFLSCALAVVWAARGIAPEYLPLLIAPFAAAALCFAFAAMLPSGDRTTFVALAGAAPLAAWAVSLGYGPLGSLLHAAAIVGTACAVAGIPVLSTGSRLVVCAAIGIAASILVTLAIAPFSLPIGGVWIYGVMALCGAFLAAAAAPPRPLARAIAAIMGWLVAAGVILAVYRLPLAPS